MKWSRAARCKAAVNAKAGTASYGGSWIVRNRTIVAGGLPPSRYVGSLAQEKASSDQKDMLCVSYKCSTVPKCHEHDVGVDSLSI